MGSVTIPFGLSGTAHWTVRTGRNKKGTKMFRPGQAQVFVEPDGNAVVNFWAWEHAPDGLRVHLPTITLEGNPVELVAILDQIRKVLADEVNSRNPMAELLSKKF